MIVNITKNLRKKKEKKKKSSFYFHYIQFLVKILLISYVPK